MALFTSRTSTIGVATICMLSGLAAIGARADDIAATAPKFRDEPVAHKLYDRMNEALLQAESLSYSCRYETEGVGKFKMACIYRVWLKKPNYFRMETEDADGKMSGVLVGDGENLWIYWPNGRPIWANLEKSKDDRTQFTSYMTKPAPLAKHSILHEAVFLGGGMVFPILDPSTFHGHVDSLAPHLNAVRSLGTETVQGEEYDRIEVGLAGHQRVWQLSLSKRDHLPRRLKETVHTNIDHLTHEEWSSVIVKGEIPKATFVWTPPVGWTEWKLPNADECILKSSAKAPDFNLASIDGGRIRLSQFQGKPVWLCFWRVGCPPCRVEMPYLQDIYTKCKDRELVVLGINVSDDRPITLDYLREASISFPNVLDTSEAGEIAFQAYGGGAIPMNYIIDGHGRVVDAWVGLSESQARVKAALKKVDIELP